MALRIVGKATNANQSGLNLSSMNNTKPEEPRKNLFQKTGSAAEGIARFLNPEISDVIIGGGKPLYRQGKALIQGDQEAFNQSQQEFDKNVNLRQGLEATGEAAITGATDALTAGLSKFIPKGIFTRGAVRSIGQETDNAARPLASRTALGLGDFVRGTTGAVKGIPSKIYQSGIDVTKRTGIREFLSGKDIAKEGLESGISGGARKIVNQSNEGIKLAGEEIVKHLKTRTKDMVDFEKLVQESTDPVIKELTKSGDNATAKAVRETADSIIKANGKRLNTMKIYDINKTLNESVANTFKKDAVSEIGEAVELTQRLISDKIRGTLHSKYKTTVGKALNDQHFYYRLKEAAASRGGAEQASGIISRSVGEAASLPLKLLTTPGITTNLARATNATGKAIGKVGSAVGAANKATAPLRNPRALTQFLRGGVQNTLRKDEQ